MTGAMTKSLFTMAVCVFICRWMGGWLVYQCVPRVFVATAIPTKQSDKSPDNLLKQPSSSSSRARMLQCLWLAAAIFRFLARVTTYGR